MSLADQSSVFQSPFGAGLRLTEDRLDIAEAVLAGAWRTLRAAGFGEAEVQALFDQIADRPEDLARRLRKMANAAA
jgi:glutathione S-transferase